MTGDAPGRRRRALILVALFFLVVTIWFAGAVPADRHAGHVEARLRQAVAGVPFGDLLTASHTEARSELEDRAGITIWLTSAPDHLLVNADATRAWTFWQPRCVVVRADPDGVISGVVDDADCHRAQLPD